MRIQLLTLLLLFACSLTAAAQKKKYSEEEFRAKKQAYITEKAGLTPEEADKFFPIYFELQNKKKEIYNSLWCGARRGVKPETHEGEYEKIIDEFFDEQQRVTEVEKEYIQQYRKVISNKKIYMIYWAEIKFNRNMMKILQKMDDKNE